MFYSSHHAQNWLSSTSHIRERPRVCRLDCTKDDDIVNVGSLAKSVISPPSSAFQVPSAPTQQYNVVMITQTSASWLTWPMERSKFSFPDFINEFWRVKGAAFRSVNCINDVFQVFLFYWF